LAVILRARNDLKTKFRNLALFPTGLAVADEVCTRQLDHIHAYWLTGASTVAFVASQVAGVNWSYSAHSYDIFMTDNLIQEKTRSASFGRAISELGRREILRRSPDAGAGRLKVIRLGVASIDRAQRAGAPARSIRLLCPASLIAVKGHVYLLEALRRVVDAGVDCHCVFAGDGKLRATLARKIRDLQLENVVSMPGMIRHKILLQQLRSGAYDVVVLASVERGTEFEGIPASLIEAMAAGIPCIATNTGAISELISDRCGVLVPQKDPAAMSEAIIALASDPARRKEIGVQARRRVAEEFDAGLAARSLIELMTGAESSQT
jgi:glycosyltransferase involved in cell wall biosynthesis